MSVRQVRNGRALAPVMLSQVPLVCKHLPNKSSRNLVHATGWTTEESYNFWQGQ